MGDDLPVAPGEIRRGCHRMEICLPFGRSKWCTRQFAVRHRNAVIGHDLIHAPDIFRAGLVTESARTSVNQDGDLSLEQTERFCAFNVENSFDALNFEEMIARAERAELIDPPLLGTLRHGIGAGRDKAAVLFDQFCI